jgi:hypothetical protein
MIENRVTKEEFVNGLLASPETQALIEWETDLEGRWLTFYFAPEFYDKGKQNLLTTMFEGQEVTVHEANIRKMVRVLQHVAATGEYPESL